MKLSDVLKPKGDTLQVLLLKRGEPHSGIYKDDQREVTSPNLPRKEDDAKDAPEDR
jgi:hypothetical protein